MCGTRTSTRRSRARDSRNSVKLRSFLFDDVFSELDDKRAALLAELLPAGQVLLATAVDPPSALSGNVVDIADVRRGTSRGSEVEVPR